MLNFGQLEETGKQVVTFVQNATAQINVIIERLNEANAKLDAALEKVTRIEAAHESIMGWIAESDDELLADVASEIASSAEATATAAASIAEAATEAIASVEASAAATETETATEEVIPVETPPADTPANETQPDETPANETPQAEEVPPNEFIKKKKRFLI